MKARDFIHQLAGRLTALYDSREASNIANYLVESVLSKENIRSNTELTSETLNRLHEASSQLMQGKPVQYATNEAWFYGMKLFVDSRVLIPRPETEELAELVIKNNLKKDPAIIDFCTGSGCIALALKKHIPEAHITATDFSHDALDVAVLNANRNQLQIDFKHHDSLNDPVADLPYADTIVSNPPYVDIHDISTMHKNVIDFEPHEALFPPGDDQLIYYRKISSVAKLLLNINGRIYFEIPDNKSSEICAIIIAAGFKNVTLHRDMQNKFRFISAEN